MTQGESILQFILDHPEDDTPRLVYADFLDDHGDPDRAEFIRVQIELARLVPGPDAYSRLGYVEGGTRSTTNRVECVWTQDAAEEWARLAHSRYRELTLREEELLAAHGERWAEPVRPFVLDGAFVPSRMFRRGFVERVQVALSTFPEHGAALFRQAPIVELKLHTDLEADEPIAAALALPDLGRLTALGIQAFEATAPAVNALANARHLCQLSWLALQVEMGNTDVEVLASLPHLASLTDLHLEQNIIEPPGVAALAASPHFRRLRSLYLGWNPVGNEGLAHLRESPLLDRLTTLDLCNTHIGDSPEVVALLESPRLASLTTLYLGQGFDLVPAELQALTRSPYLRLTTLDLNEVPLDLDSARALAASSALAHLTTLNLSLMPPRDDRTEALAALVASSALARLAALNLSGNWSESPVALALASSPHLANLTFLNLNYNDIGTDGALALARSTTLPALTEVLLHDNKIEPEGIEALRQRFGEGLVL